MYKESGLAQEKAFVSCSTLNGQFVIYKKDIPEVLELLFQKIEEHIKKFVNIDTEQRATFAEIERMNIAQSDFH